MLKGSVRVLAILALALGCSSPRKAGQVELFLISDDNRFERPGESEGAEPATTDTLTEGRAQVAAAGRSEKDAPAQSTPGDLPVRKDLVRGAFGDRIRFADDVIAVQVHSIYLHALAGKSGFRDIIVFAEIWENAATGYDSSEKLNTIVFVAQNQKIPGRVNMTGNLAYGPTVFKGHPMRIRFTVLILKKRKSDQLASAAGIVQSFLNGAGSAVPYSSVASKSVGVLRDVLRTQADTTAFDFEYTAMSDNPEELQTTLASAEKNVALAKLRSVAADLRAPTDRLQNFLDHPEKLQQDDVVEDLERLKAIAPEVLRAKCKHCIDNKNNLSSDEFADHLQEIVRVSEALLNIAELHTSPWDDRIPWLEWGFFALVETNAVNEKIEQFNLDDHDKWRLDGGWIRKGDKPLDTNYVVFSITPRQINETAEVLRAASRRSEELLVSLTRRDTTVEQVQKSAEELGKSLSTDIARTQAKRLARDIATAVQAKGGDYEMFKTDFEGKWTNFANLVDGKNQIPDAVKTQIKTELLARWALRFAWKPAPAKPAAPK